VSAVEARAGSKLCATWYVYAYQIMQKLLHWDEIARRKVVMIRMEDFYRNLSDKEKRRAEDGE
jgi:hypothetical protein